MEQGDDDFEVAEDAGASSSDEEAGEESPTLLSDVATGR